MEIDILTIFPNMFAGPFDESMIKRARDERIATIRIHDLRIWSTDNHRSVDAPPYGGGAGMIMRVDVIDRAVADLKANSYKLKAKTILLDTKGKFYTQQHARKLAKAEHLILIAGHYEGVDHRVHDHIVDEVFSIGPYVLTGGELPAMVVVDTIVRLLPGVLGNPDSLQEESYSKLLKANSYKLEARIEYPQYTRPEVYRGWKVPKVLLSGNHREIDQWREEQAKKVAF